MKKLIVFTCMLLLVSTAVMGFDAEFGMRFGIAVGNTAFDPEFDEVESGWSDDNMLLGLCEGLIIWIPLNERSDIQAELLYMRKGDKYAEDDYDIKIIADYIALPVLYRYHMNDRLALCAGPGFNYLASGMLKYYDDDVFEIRYLKDDMKTFELDLNAAVQYAVMDKVTAELRYSYGVTKVLDEKIFDVDFTAKTSTFILSAAYKF